MVLLKVPINREKLKSIPESELQLYVLSQVIVSEINILQKFLILQPTNSDNLIVEMAQNSQRFFLLRILAGKLVESWDVLGKQFFGAKLSQLYEPLLGIKGKDSLQKLKSYFGKSNALTYVRNMYAFHYSQGSQELLDKLKNFPDSDPLEIYIAKEEGNCYYSMAQLLLNFSFVESFEGLDVKEKIENLFSEILSVASWFISLFQCLIIAITKRHLDFDGVEVQIPDPPSFSDIEMPYFISK